MDAVYFINLIHSDGCGSYEQGLRNMLIYWLELLSAQMYYQFGYLDTTVMLLHIIGVRVLLSLVWYLDIALSLVITLDLCCHNDG